MSMHCKHNIFSVYAVRHGKCGQKKNTNIYENVNTTKFGSKNTVKEKAKLLPVKWSDHGDTIIIYSLLVSFLSLRSTFGISQSFREYCVCVFAFCKFIAMNSLTETAFHKKPHRWMRKNSKRNEMA